MAASSTCAAPRSCISRDRSDGAIVSREPVRCYLRFDSSGTRIYFRAQAFVFQNARDEPDVAVVMPIVAEHREGLAVRAFRKVRKFLAQHVAIRILVEFGLEN